MVAALPSRARTAVIAMRMKRASIWTSEFGTAGPSAFMIRREWSSDKAQFDGRNSDQVPGWICCWSWTVRLQNPSTANLDAACATRSGLIFGYGAIPESMIERGVGAPRGDHPAATARLI